ncbi:MAG: helix-turn-helix domain-containing protein [Anaerotignum sp.]|nr:helix-turn-helix domain-containing protein [Anaerotignum sp.]
MTILEIRKLTALNRAEFARKYNIPYRTIEDWEKERSVPPPYVAELLEKVVRTDFDIPEQ